MSNDIYFDNAATTMMCDEALEVFTKYSKELYYNASAAYTPAVKIEKNINNAKKSILNLLNASSGKVYFTSGGTESDNLAILGAAKKSRKKHIISSAIEHPAVLNALKELESKGYDVTYLSVDQSGFVSHEELYEAITNETFLVTIMHINNETGAVQDIKKLASIVKDKDESILFHSDGIQAYGKIPVDIDDLNIDMYSLSSHKLHGPKGMGALYVRNDKKILPISYGGGQQESMRPGTINSAGILAFIKAMELADYSKENDNNMYKIKSYLSDKISNEINDVLCVSRPQGHSNYILNVAFKNINAETLLHTCQYAGLIISTGSACSSRKNVVSHTLKQMEINKDYIGGAVRLSFSRYNSMDEAQAAFKIIKDSVKKLREYTRP